jgi:hypothetical protein
MTSQTAYSLAFENSSSRNHKLEGVDLFGTFPGYLIPLIVLMPYVISYALAGIIGIHQVSHSNFSRSSNIPQLGHTTDRLDRWLQSSGQTTPVR